MTDGLSRRRAIGFGLAVALHLAVCFALRDALAPAMLAAEAPGSEIAVRLVSEAQAARQPPRKVAVREFPPEERPRRPPEELPRNEEPVLHAVEPEIPRAAEMRTVALAVPDRPAEDSSTVAKAPAAAASPAQRGTDAPVLLSPPRYDAAYLSNPAPAYPPLSRRLGEQGRVLLRVRVSSEGEAQAIEIAASSGYARLDEAAQAVVRRWRFVPARKGDQPFGAWVNIPVVFKLN